jgi:hypothetical protein
LTEPFLVTPRLVLRSFAVADTEHIVALHSDPEVMLYIGRPAARAQLLAEALPPFYERRRGFGRWIAELGQGEVEYALTREEWLS